jgi:hypothetical protein
MRTAEVACPSCGAKPGEKCNTPVDGVDTQWDHDTRILAAMFTDPPADACGARPCRDGDHYGQCRSVTSAGFKTP